MQFNLGGAECKTGKKRNMKNPLPRSRLDFYLNLEKNLITKSKLSFTSKACINYVII